MEFMRRPRQCQQHIHIEEIGHHSNSDSSSFTRSVVILGESRGTSNTTTPFTMRVGVGLAKPFRTNSEAAFPKATDRASEYRRRISKASSSRLRVVRICSDDATNY
jgi:hypothetical protein